MFSVQDKYKYLSCCVSSQEIKYDLQTDRAQPGTQLSRHRMKKLLLAQAASSEPRYLSTVMGFLRWLMISSKWVTSVITSPAMPGLPYQLSAVTPTSLELFWSSSCGDLWSCRVWLLPERRGNLRWRGRFKVKIKSMFFFFHFKSRFIYL